MILHLFTLLFVGLKLTDVIDWSWPVVLAPSLLFPVLWGTFTVATLIALGLEGGAR